MKKNLLTTAMISGALTMLWNISTHAEVKLPKQSISQSQIEYSPTDLTIIALLEDQEHLSVLSYADGNLMGAVRMLQDGLAESLQVMQSTPENRYTTNRAIVRAIELSQSLMRNINSQNEIEVIAVYQALRTSYQMIKMNYFPLDLQFYTHFIRSCRRAGNYQPEYSLIDFEKRLFGIIHQQIAAFEKTFILINQSEGVIPKYDSKVFMIAMQSLLKSISEDLMMDPASQNPSLFPSLFARTSFKLNRVSKRLDQYLAGSSVFSGDRRAINSSYLSLKKALETIN